MKIIYVLPVMVLSLAGCSTPTTGVIDRGNGVMTVTHQAPTAYHPTDPLKISATKEAGDYCASLGKKFIFLHSKETQGRPIQYPESEVIFKCE